MIAAIVALLMFSAFFSASETAFSSMNVIRMKSWAEDGNERAAKTLAIQQEYDRFISAVLIGNNIVNIGASSLGTVLFTMYFMEYGASISTVVLTVVVLIFGEVTPKSVAKAMPEKFAMAVTPVISLVMKLFYVFTVLLNAWTKLVQKIIKPDEDTGITGDELISMVSEAEQEGGLDEDESELIRSAIEFGDRVAEEAMIPRVDVVMVSDDMSMEEVEQTFFSSDFSRLPVYHTNRDNILGYVHVHDLYQLQRQNRQDWLSALRPVVFASHTEQIHDLFQSLQRKKTHMAIVVDAYGGTMGIITMEDILEELVGEIWDEHDEVREEEIRRQEDNSYLVASSAGLDDVFELFDLRVDDCEASTISAWVVDELGHVPEAGDTFVYEAVKVTVTKMQKMRVMEIHIERVEAEDDEKDDDD